MQKVTGLCSILLLIAWLAGCSAETSVQSAHMTRYTFQHGGLEREYFVFLPSNYSDDIDHPVAIFLHGYGGTATGTEAEVAQGLNRYADKNGYVMVYPQGTWFVAGDSPDTQWEVTSWNHISDGFDESPDGPACSVDFPESLCPPECGTCGKCGWTSCHDDIGFLKRLVKRISADFRVDAESFFVSGFSNGAMMANRMACEAPELFAAAALVGGRVERGFECTPAKRLPLLQMNGGNDETVPFDGRQSSGGYFYSSTESVARHWTDGLACAAKSEDWSSDSIRGENVQCSISCGATTHETIDCVWPEGNHRWPGTLDFRGSNGYCVSELQAASMPDQLICMEPDPDTDFWGSHLMFEFFDEHRGK